MKTPDDGGTCPYWAGFDTDVPPCGRTTTHRTTYWHDDGSGKLKQCVRETCELHALAKLQESL